MVIQNTLYLSLNLDMVLITHVKAKLILCCLRSHTWLLQYKSLLNILLSALLMMLQRFGMICLMMYTRPFLSTHSERSSKPISAQSYPPEFLLFPLSLRGTDPAMTQVNNYSSLLFLFGAPRICL